MIAVPRRNARIVHRLAVPAAFGAIAALSACRDSTGPKPGPANISAFAVDVRFVGGAPSAAVQAAFTAAAARVSRVITGALAPINATGFNAATACNDTALPVLNEVVPNLIIYAEFGPIDGVGGVLGQSGPCALRTSTSLPFLGIMKFDSADLATAVANGTINAVVLHEMQHVLGFGTLWSGPPDFPTTLLQAPSTSNPVYLGAAARAQYVAAGGTSASGVPVEGGTTIGTSNSHWRESVFSTELMTGFLNGSSQPFSRISIGALADLGYTVSYSASDAFAVPPPGALRLAPDAATDATFQERLIRPRFKVDASGRVTTVLPDTAGSIVSTVTPAARRPRG